MKFTTAAAAFFLGAAAHLASATPVTHQVREEWSPPILVPNANTVWNSGETQTVTWDNTYAPVNITNSVGRIILRFAQVETPVLLAWGFDIRAGSVDITVPNVYTDTDYSIVLFGDSGNWSPTFTINGPIW